MQHKNLSAVDSAPPVAGNAVSGDVAENSDFCSITDDQDVLPIAGAPSAGRIQVDVIGVTLLIRQSGDRGYELLLRSGAHVWRPRSVWLKSDTIPAAVVARDLRLLVTLLRDITPPGVLTERETADTMIGLQFIATLDDRGNLVAAEIPDCAGAPT